MGKKLVHVEFPAQDVDRAETFWEGVGGWSIESAGMPGIDYRMYQEDGQGGAVYTQQGGEQGPVIYFGSDDIDGDLAKVRELGGEAEDKQPIPHVGWFARCKDTEGNPFSLFQSDESVPAPEGAPGP
jgi:predicted enzyme related to lactoylglutathione lyase